MKRKTEETTIPKMTKREVFAAFALAGFCSNSSLGNLTDEQTARWSVNHADELLRQLKKKREVNHVKR